MEKTKAVIFLLAASLVIVAVAGISFAQSTGAQTPSNSPNQIPQGSGANYPYPQQGYNPYGPGQPASPYGPVGRGMCGCRR